MERYTFFDFELLFIDGEIGVGDSFFHVGLLILPLLILFLIAHWFSSHRKARRERELIDALKREQS